MHGSDVRLTEMSVRRMCPLLGVSIIRGFMHCNFNALSYSQDT